MTSDSDREQRAWKLIPMIRISSGEEWGIYLPLLNLAPDGADALSMLQEIAENNPNIEELITDLLIVSNWRPHLVGAAYVLFVGVSDRVRPALWSAIDRGSWVCPQLAVVAYLRDHEFASSAKERVVAAVKDEAFTDAKGLSSLIYLCKRMESTQAWLEDALKSQSLYVYLEENDTDPGHRFARRWLWQLKQVSRVPIVEPEPITVRAAYRSGDLFELMDMLDNDRQDRLKKWAVGLAVRKVQRVLGAFRESHPDDDRPFQAVTGAQAWLSSGQPPQTRMLDDAEKAARMAAPSMYRDHKLYPLNFREAIWGAAQGNKAWAAANAAYHTLTAAAAEDPTSALEHAWFALAASIAASGSVSPYDFLKPKSYHMEDRVSDIARRALLRGAYTIAQQ